MNSITRPSDIEVDRTFLPDNQKQYPSHYEEELKPSSQSSDQASYSSSSQESTEDNEFYYELIELQGTLHKNFIHHRKEYTIFVHQTPLLEGGHHAIVISDGVNDDAITFELTVMSGKAGAMFMGGRTIAKVVIYEGDMSKLKKFGEVTCTLYELTQTAANVLNSDRQYNWLSNNCQHFCNRFLEARGLPPYTTDTRKVVTAVAVGAAVGTTAAAATFCTIF